MAAPTFGLFANPESRRIDGFGRALGEALRERPLLWPWERVLSGSDWKPPAELRPVYLRLESPGRNFRVEKLLLALGATAKDEEANRGWSKLSALEITALAPDPGRILPQRQWFLGWREILHRVNAWATEVGLADRWLCPPADVLRMFDKAQTQLDLEAAAIPVPPALGVPGSFDELWSQLERTGQRRVFLKPCHGSSASGVVALERTPRHVQAFTTAELVACPDGLRLYNHRRIRRYQGLDAVRPVVNALCRERCLAQIWVPKAGMAGHPFDVRVVVIGGIARHLMVRYGRGPITNSQLLGGRGDPTELERRMGGAAWQNLLGVCERVATEAYPRCLYLACDVLVEPNFRTVRVLEVNAFGDLLPGIECEGRDTYAWEIAEALRWARSRGILSSTPSPKTDSRPSGSKWT